MKIKKWYSEKKWVITLVLPIPIIVCCITRNPLLVFDYNGHALKPRENVEFYFVLVSGIVNLLPFFLLCNFFFNKAFFGFYRMVSRLRCNIFLILHLKMLLRMRCSFFIISASNCSCFMFAFLTRFKPPHKKKKNEMYVFSLIIVHIYCFFSPSVFSLEKSLFLIHHLFLILHISHTLQSTPFRMIFFNILFLEYLLHGLLRDFCESYLMK